MHNNTGQLCISGHFGQHKLIHSVQAQAVYVMNNCFLKFCREPLKCMPLNMALLEPHPNFYRLY